MFMKRSLPVKNTKNFSAAVHKTAISRKTKSFGTGSNAVVSELAFLNFFARDVWRALSVLSITTSRNHEE